MMEINSLTRYFLDIRRQLSTVANAFGWPEFQLQIERHIIHTSLPPHVILPIACASAVGGNPQRALSVSTACALLILCMRWFDDVQDHDRRESLWEDIGPGRTINMAAAALSAAWFTLVKDEELPKTVLHTFGKYTIELAHGQDIDLKGGLAPTMDDYWRLMHGKTGAALALGCEAGVLAACPNKKLEAEACGRFGSHMGVLLQILDDLDGTFHPDGIGDLHVGKITLPVLYGLAIDHPARQELVRIVHAGHLAQYGERVRAILESIDTREFLVWSAFEERRLALACLRGIPETSGDDVQSGRNALTAFADSLLVEWERLLERREQPL